jgi:hypothetical protein
VKIHCFLLHDYLFSCRYAGVRIISEISTRTGASQETRLKNQLILDSILPFKEEITQLLKQRLRDSEVKVTALSSVAINRISWWP